MKDRVAVLIRELKQENADRNIAMYEEGCSEYAHTVLVSTYNQTLEFIKRLENLI